MVTSPITALPDLSTWAFRPPSTAWPASASARDPGSNRFACSPVRRGRALDEAHRDSPRRRRAARLRHRRRGRCCPLRGYLGGDRTHRPTVGGSAATARTSRRSVEQLHPRVGGHHGGRAEHPSDPRRLERSAASSPGRPHGRIPDLVASVVSFRLTPRRALDTRAPHASTTPPNCDHIEALDRLTGRSADLLTMPVTAIYSRRDGIVDWLSCVDQETPERDQHRGRSTHIGLRDRPRRLARRRRRGRPGAAAEPGQSLAASGGSGCWCPSARGPGPAARRRSRRRSR